MDKSLIKIIPVSFLEQIQKDLGTSAVIALKRLDKVVTGKTAKSITTDSNVGNEEIDISVFGGGATKYIIEGKPANTKLPMKKNGSKWELVQELKDWKAIRGFGGSDYLLARAIAKNKREPIDLGQKTLDVFNELYASKIESKLFSYVISSVTGEIKNTTNG